MEKKLRIQLFDPDGKMLSDRLVTQEPEFSKGPNEKHDGPMRIEFTLDSQPDIEKAKRYLDQLIGILPLGPKKGRKVLSKKIHDPEHRETFLENILSISEDQDQLIKNLREKGFKFVMTDFLKTFDFFDKLDIKKVHLENYQWMILLNKPAKNPKSDKYDPMLLFGIKLMDERSDKVVIYVNGTFHKSVKLEIPEKSEIDFKKTDMIKFPHYMVEEEREKFRYEHRQYKDNPEKKYSKFYKRWKPFVENLPELPQDKN